MLALLAFITVFTLVGFFLVLNSLSLSSGRPARAKYPSISAGFACLGVAFLLALAMILLII